MSEYFIPAGPGEAEFTEKRSRFLGHIRHVDSEEEAKAFINQIKKEHSLSDIPFCNADNKPEVGFA